MELAVACDASDESRPSAAAARPESLMASRRGCSSGTTERNEQHTPTTKSNGGEINGGDVDRERVGKIWGKGGLLVRGHRDSAGEFRCQTRLV